MLISLLCDVKVKTAEQEGKTTKPRQRGKEQRGSGDRAINHVVKYRTGLLTSGQKRAILRWRTWAHGKRKSNCIYIISRPRHFCQLSLIVAICRLGFIFRDKSWQKQTKTGRSHSISFPPRQSLKSRNKKLKWIELQVSEGGREHRRSEERPDSATIVFSLYFYIASFFIELEEDVGREIEEREKKAELELNSKQLGF